jgi:trans-aconitate methyltransferase
MGDADWRGYYAATLGRKPRPLFTRALEHASSPGQAIEIGFGDGTEVLALLKRGWRVLAVDPEPRAAEMLRPRAAKAFRDRLTIATASADEVDLPPFDFLYAGYSLPFLERTALGRAWMRFRAQLRPGGLLAVNLFGPNDSWASRPDMSFVDRDALLGLVDGLDVLVLDEQERDGDAYSGPKHWHVFDIIARQPKDIAG